MRFANEDFGFAISLSMPIPLPYPTAFMLDPEIKSEAIWGAGVYHPSSLLVERRNAMVRAREGDSWTVLDQHADSCESFVNIVRRPAKRQRTASYDDDSITGGPTNASASNKIPLAVSTSWA
nr:hypothetical protein [Pseudomonas sp. CC120222-01a]